MTYIKQLKKSYLCKVEMIIAIIGLLFGFVRKTKNDYKFRLLHPVGLLIFILVSLLTIIQYFPGIFFRDYSLAEELKYLKKENFILI